MTAGVNGVSGATDYQRYDDNRFYDMFFNGTSAASPIVAGVVALYMQSNPSATSYDVHEWIKRHGSKGDLIPLNLLMSILIVMMTTIGEVYII